MKIIPYSSLLYKVLVEKEKKYIREQSNKFKKRKKELQTMKYLNFKKINKYKNNNKNKCYLV